MFGQIHHHQFLLLLLERRASMKSFQALRSPAIPLTSFHDLPIFLILSSIVLRHILFGLPLLLYPWGFQSNAVFSIAPAFLHNVCPIQFRFLLFIWISVGFCLVILHSSSFVMNHQLWPKWCPWKCATAGTCLPCWCHESAICTVIRWAMKIQNKYVDLKKLVCLSVKSYGF